MAWAEDGADPDSQGILLLSPIHSRVAVPMAELDARASRFVSPQVWPRDRIKQQPNSRVQRQWQVVDLQHPDNPQPKVRHQMRLWAVASLGQPNDRENRQP